MLGVSVSVSVRLWRSSWIDVRSLLDCSLAIGVGVNIVGAVGRIARSLRAVKGRLGDVDVGSGPSSDKFDKMVAILILVSMPIPMSAPLSMSVSVFMFGPGSGSASNRDEVEVDPEYSVGVELGAKVAAVARELEPEPELELDPDSNPDPEPGPSGKPCILSSPPTSSL